MNRILKKQEVIDEEKRVRIQELRQTGHIVESTKTDVPFGVRAIQSGIQVDGIWISNTSTPVPSELRFSKNHPVSTTDSSSGADSNKSTTGARHGPFSAKPLNSEPQTSASLSSPYSDREPALDSIEASDLTNARQSYQPRKASLLRYNKSNGAYDEETLGQLEGTAPQIRLQTRQPRTSHQNYSEAESSAADNEANSVTSSDSGKTFSDVKVKAPPKNPKSILKTPKTGYFPVATDTPSYEWSDPFASPADGFMLSSSQTGQRPSWLDNSQINPFPDNSQANPHQDAQSPFIPGALHQNRDSRRVNSGFEVLPAGTFQPTIDRKGKGVDRSDAMDEDSGERKKSARLQKKRKDSAVYERPPSSDNRQP